MWLNELLSGVAGIILGTFFGNWLAIGRDRRKERNEVRLPLWHSFNDDIGRISTSRIPNIPDYRKINNYKARISKREWRKFESHINPIEDIHRKNIKRDSLGGIIFNVNESDMNDAKKHLKELIKLTRQR